MTEFEKKYRGLLGNGEDGYIDYDGILSLIEENEKLKRLRELLVEAAHCIHEMEGMAYADADPDDFAKHAMEFRGNVSETIGADAPWNDTPDRPGCG